ncbi:MAG: elongation factor P [Clostridiales bacterium]|nr:elongation factor P [Clostridiales bacterium]
MISAGDIRKGVTIEIDGKLWNIVDFQHVKPGKGSAFVRTKIKNIMTGAVVERTFNPNDKFKKAHIETKNMQYLYNDGELYYFMDNDTYEQIPLEHSFVEDALPFIKENDQVLMQLYLDKPFSVTPQNFVILEITETDPGFKGDTANNVTKPATTETGYVVHVPIFVNIGDKVRIDTRTGEYMERA